MSSNFYFQKYLNGCRHFSSTLHPWQLLFFGFNSILVIKIKPVSYYPECIIYYCEDTWVWIIGQKIESEIPNAKISKTEIPNHRSWNSRKLKHPKLNARILKPRKPKSGMPKLRIGKPELPIPTSKLRVWIFSIIAHWTCTV